MSLDFHGPVPVMLHRPTTGRTQSAHMGPQYKIIRRKMLSAKLMRDVHNHHHHLHHQIARKQVDIQPQKSVVNNTNSSHENKLIFAPAKDQYLKGELERDHLDDDPFVQFHQWFSQASNTAGVTQPEATTLSTAHLPSGRVSARMVYLKELDKKGFVVYSNWGTSRKSEDINSNPHASLTFWWKELERQVRVEGITERLTSEESQVYYDTRNRGSRIGAWASQQSSILEDRSELDEQVEDITKRFDGQEKIPVPPFWGGLRIIPTYIEFWQGRDSRLHDRFTFTRDSVDDKTWTVDRVSP